MKIDVLFAIALWSASCYANTLNLRYFVDDKYTKVSIVQIGELKVNELCKKKSTCQAVTTANGKPVKSRGANPSYLDGAAGYCWDVGAKTRILKDDKNNDYDFCVFDDGSMIDAWNLFNKHYPVKRVK